MYCGVVHVIPYNNAKALYLALNCVSINSCAVQLTSLEYSLCVDTPEQYLAEPYSQASKPSLLAAACDIFSNTKNYATAKCYSPRCNYSSSSAQLGGCREATHPEIFA